VTLVCHSKTLTVAQKAADSSPSKTSRPRCSTAVAASARRSRNLGIVRKTNRAVVVEEGWPHVGIGAQVVDLIQRDAFDDLDAPVQRVTQADVPMPYNKHLERAAKASPEKLSRRHGRFCT